jgi:hypothetical protein
LPILDLAPQAAFREPEGGPALTLSLGLDEIGEALSLRKVDSAILKRSASELARLGQPHALQGAKLPKERVDDRAATVALEFHRVLSCGASRPVETQNERIVERLARRIP